MRLCAVPHGPEVRVNFPQKGVNNKAKAKAIKRMAGHVIEPGDIRRIRPGMGLAPKWFDEVVGKQVKSDVKAGLAVDWDEISTEKDNLGRS